MNVTEILATEESKLNFLKGLIRIAKSDGVHDEDELAFYYQVANSFGLSEKSIAELNQMWDSDKEKIDIYFDTNKEKMFFFIEAIQLCWMDDEYNDVEKREIYQIAEELHISTTAVKSVESWAQEGIEWTKRGELLLELA